MPQSPRRSTARRHGLRPIAAVVALSCAACGARTGLGDESPSPTSLVPAATPTLRACAPVEVARRTFVGYSISSARAREGTIAVGRWGNGSAKTFVTALDDTGLDVRWETPVEGHAPELFDAREGWVLATTKGTPSIAKITRLSTSGELGWAYTHASKDEGLFTHVREDGDALYAVGMTTPYASDASTPFAIRFTQAGDVAWSRSDPEPLTGGLFAPSSRPFGAYVDGAHRLVVGYKLWINGGHGPMRVRALSPSDGATAWTHDDPTVYERGSAWILLPLAAGGAFVAGSVSVDSPSLGPSRATKLSDAGGPVRTALLAAPAGGQQLLADALETSDGRVLAVGYVSATVSGTLLSITSDLTVARSLPVVRSASVDSIVPMPSGGYLLAWAQNVTSEGLVGWELRRLNDALETLWSYRVPGVGSPSLRRPIPLGGGRIALAGAFYDPSASASDALVVVLDETCR